MPCIPPLFQVHIITGCKGKVDFFNSIFANLLLLTNKNSNSKRAISSFLFNGFSSDGISRVLQNILKLCQSCLQTVCFQHRDYEWCPT